MSQFRNGVIAVFICIYIACAANLKGQNRLIEGVESYRLLVKFRPESRLVVSNRGIQFWGTFNQRSNLQVIMRPYTSKQVLSYSIQEEKLIREGRHLDKRIGFNRLAFCGLVEIIEAPTLSPTEVLELADKLETFDDVEYCAIEDVEPTPPPSTQKVRATPDFSYRQWYKELNHGGDTIGINIEAAWEKGIKGAGVSIADVEWGMDYLHEDLMSPKFIEGLKTTNANYDDHGTAVAGILIAKENGFGVTGMVPDYDAFYGFSEITKGRVAAIAMAIDSLEAGDVIIYEMQTGGQGGEFVPADYNQGVWDITKAATDAGILVCAAAGNGNQNLDGSYYSSYMARGDNGAIIVGAGTIKGRNKASFSTYGSRVDVQGWGDFCVTTTGYTSLYNGGPHAKYTKNFSGTSSATPIVTSAVVAIQSYAKSALGKALTSREMRTLLKKTGTPQGSGGHIGPLPNVGAAIEELGGSIVDTYELTIDGGSGGGSYKEGEKVTIVAENSNANETFSHWDGDVKFVADVSKKTTTVTMPARDIALTAVWSVDTLKSENLLSFAKWEAIVDTIGSKAILIVDTTSSEQKLSVSLEKTKQPNDTTYPYANGTGYFENSFDEVHTLELRYSATADMKLLLPMENSTDSDGSAHFVQLSKGENRTVQFSPDDFMQPLWQKSKTPLDLNKVSSVSFEIDGDENKEYAADLEVFSFKMDDYLPTGVVSAIEKGSNSHVAVRDNIIHYTVSSQQIVSLQVLGLNGKVYYKSTKLCPRGTHSLLLNDISLATGTYLLQFSSKTVSETVRFIKR